MKTRRHHNNKGLRQIKRGKTREQVKRIAKRLDVPYAKQEVPYCDDCKCMSPYGVERCGLCGGYIY